MKTLIIIPTYNETDCIEKLIPQIFSLNLNLHILVVDDNSPDGTSLKVESLQKNYPYLFLLKRPNKAGLGQAYLAGFAWAKNSGYESVVQMDADFSHSPTHLKDILLALADHDFVVGSRYVKNGGVVNWPLKRKLISRGGSFYARTILGLPIRDLTGGFNAWKISLLDKFSHEVKSNGYCFQIDLKHRAVKLGATWREVPIIFEERRNGQSKLKGKIVWEAIWRVWQIKFKDLNWRLIGGLAAILLTTIAAYWPLKNFTFTYWDDNFQIFTYPAVSHLTWHSLKEIFTGYSPALGMYQPLASLSLALGYKIFGSWGGGLHLINLGYHLLNIILVWWLAKLLFKKNYPALIVAMLFAWHPLNIESVAWLSASSTLLFAMFYLAALISYLYYLQQKKFSLLVGVFLFFLLSCLSKMSAISLPFLLLVFDWLKQRNDKWQKIILEKIPFFTVALATAAWGFYIRTHSHLDKVSHHDYNWFDYYLLPVRSLFFYLEKFILPLWLSPFYPQPAKTSGHLPWIYFASLGLFLLATAGLIILIKRRQRFLVFCILWFVLTLLPMLKFFPSTTPLFADRYMYLPLIGLALFFVTVGQKFILYQPHLKKIISTAAFIYLVFLIFISRQQLAIWTNDIARWTRVLEIFPNDSQAYDMRAENKLMIGDTAGALADFTLAVKVNPQDAGALNNIGYLLAEKLNRPAAALDYYRRSISYDSQQATTFYNLANALKVLNRPLEALKNYDIALKLDSQYGAAYYYRGLTYQQLGGANAKRGCDDLRQALKLGITPANEALKLCSKK